MVTEADVKRVFGGEWEGEAPEPQEPKTGDMRSGSPEAWDRFVAVDPESKSEILSRVRRLTAESWSWELAVDLSCGLLPEDPVKWPPLQRYRMASGISEKQIREEIDAWFWRNHCIDHDGTSKRLEP